MYGLVRPCTVTATTVVKEIIVVGFYSPPKSKKKSALLDHIITTCQRLLTKYPNAGLLIGGDRNEMNISPLLICLPKMHQINVKNSCNGKVLDVLLTNLGKYYNVPIIVPPVSADDPNRGAPSDHSTVLAVPLSNHTDNITNEYKLRIFRPLPESGIAKFGEWLESENWENLKSNMSPSEQVESLQITMNENLNKNLP